MDTWVKVSILMSIIIGLALWRLWTQREVVKASFKAHVADMMVQQAMKKMQKAQTQTSHKK